LLLLLVTAACYCCRALTEMQHDVKEAREAIAEVADNNAILAAVCLTEGATALDWSTTSHKPLHMSVSAAVHAVAHAVHAVQCVAV